MTREKFIKKWLGNKDYEYTEQNRDLMREDLDEVINQALRQPLVISSVCKCKGGAVGRTVTSDFEHQICDRCGNIAK
jgi:hypothetical protein